MAMAPSAEEVVDSRLSTLLDRPDATQTSRPKGSRLNQYLDDSALAFVDANGEVHFSAFTSKLQRKKISRRAERLLEQVMLVSCMDGAAVTSACDTCLIIIAHSATR